MSTFLEFKLAKLYSASVLICSRTIGIMSKFMLETVVKNVYTILGPVAGPVSICAMFVHYSDH